MTAEGHEARHTLELPAANHTPDTEVMGAAARDGRVLVTKDADFVNSFLLRGQP